MRFLVNQVENWLLKSVRLVYMKPYVALLFPMKAGRLQQDNFTLLTRTGFVGLLSTPH